MQRPAATMTVLLILALTSSTFNIGVAALGINCRGSSMCSGRGAAMVELRDSVMRDIDPNRQYASGQQIACTSNNICAFVQQFGGTVAGSQIGPLMQDLVDHACRTCGSVPLGFPKSNDVSQGELTVNFVTHACFRKPASDVCV